MGPPARYYKVIALLVAAAAAVKPGCLEYDKVRGDPNMQGALTGRMPAADQRGRAAADERE